MTIDELRRIEARYRDGHDYIEPSADYNRWVAEMAAVVPGLLDALREAEAENARLREALTKLGAVVDAETRLYPDPFARAAGSERVIVGHGNVEHAVGDRPECDWCRALMLTEAALAGLREPEAER